MWRSARLFALCKALDPCKTFADVGCDHGYCTQYMLENRLCERAIISDVSAPSLKKAETLLAPYRESGSLTSVCCNGLEKIPRDVSEVLIAGMGGREIVEILKRDFIPEKFVLQPMRNSEEVRRFLLSRGANIIRDDTFRDGKFYDLIKGTATGGGNDYTQEEISFGRDNIRKKNPVFCEFLEESIQKIHNYLSEEMSEENRSSLTARKRELERIHHDLVS